MTPPLTLVVIGAAGFIGRYVCRYFSTFGWRVIGVDNVSAENAPVAFLAAYHSINLPSSALVKILSAEKPTLCVHCAGRASVALSLTDPLADYHAGPVLTFELLNVLRETTPDCRLIFLSSAAVYGNPSRLPISESQEPVPISPYGFHKWQSEQICTEFATVYGLRTASLRIFSAYGPGLRRQVLWDICRKVISEGRLALQGSGAESRDFVHAQDIATAIRTVADNGSMKGEVYNLASGQETTIKELASLVLKVAGSTLSPEFDGVVPSGVPLNWRADISKIEALGFSPSITLERGVAQLVDWCKPELEGL